jgi:hypothetical protein
MSPGYRRTFLAISAAVILLPISPIVVVVIAIWVWARK